MGETTLLRRARTEITSTPEGARGRAWWVNLTKNTFFSNYGGRRIVRAAKESDKPLPIKSVFLFISCLRSFGFGRRSASIWLLPVVGVRSPSVVLPA